MLPLTAFFPFFLGCFVSSNVALMHILFSLSPSLTIASFLIHPSLSISESVFLVWAKVLLLCPKQNNARIYPAIGPAGQYKKELTSQVSICWRGTISLHTFPLQLVKYNPIYNSLHPPPKKTRAALRFCEPAVRAARNRASIWRLRKSNAMLLRIWSKWCGSWWLRFGSGCARLERNNVVVRVAELVTAFYI
jgi:hypothetical protein